VSDVELRDLVRIPVEMLVIGTDKPVKFHLRGRVTGLTEREVEIRLLDDFQPLNGFPLHLPREAAYTLEKIRPPAPT
jgi:hypothetical protein